ncbi:GNAT family N-acetyltransferase [Paractinoplanes atraurantiacus]|uniref:Acetyltransferase (GNAT) family protein n=1 Tax=Paractinoplanes atraurantiacus TaxID=1036182 RepID=A0A285INW1_9ACTN|nr:GNAT family N-acetyltransferase [Actinoplanes atraurantiacus]SNY49678.1 Acetyltransferase (GNAT) family protein [Actinoplanes atraurantiacus]
MALWRIRATVDDRPGYLSVLTASLALRSVNILAVQVHTTEAGAVDDFLVDAPDSMNETELLTAIAKGRGRNAFVARAEAQGLADQPTRALALAGRLVHEPDTLGEALVALLDATEVRWRPEPLSGGPGHDAERMRLADPAGGSLEVLRTAPAFTPAEYARAQALVELSSAMLRRGREQSTLLLPDGTELTVRQATADDLDGVRGLHERSSAATLQRRYLGGGGPTDTRLRRLLEPSGAGRTLLAIAGDRVVAMANLLTEGDLGEVAILIEDGWQRRGIGTALLRRLMAHAERGDLAAVVAHAAADNVAMLRTLRRLGAGPAERDGAMVSVTLPVPVERPVNSVDPVVN